MMASSNGGSSGPDNIQNPNGYTEKAWGNHSLTHSYSLSHSYLLTCSFV